MFDFGFGELVLVFMIGLLVLGPQRLPKVAAEIGKWVGRARRTATQLRRQLEREIELADLEANNPPPPPTPPATPETATAPNPSGAAAPPTESATTRQISDAISEHSAAAAPASAPAPQGSTDKPPA
jgi:Tat protein translocase TatB subunit